MVIEQVIEQIIEQIIESLEYKKYLSVEDEESYMQYVYNSTVGDIENFMFLTPNWIRKQECLII